MRPATFVRAALLAGLVCALPAPASAQGVDYLLLDRYELASGGELTLRFEREREGELARAAWPGSFDWLFVRVAGHQETMTELGPADASEDFVRLRTTRPGITLIGADRPERVERVDAAELRAFLAAKVGPRSLPAGWRETLGGGGRAGGLRVRRVESAKALVRVLGGQDWRPNSATAQSKTGQRVEIRPLADPTSVQVKSDLPVKVYLPGAKRGVAVTARHVDSGRTQTFFTDDGATGFFTVSVSGLWTVEAHAARPLPDDPGADWEVATATLTFEVPHWDPREGRKR